MVSYIVTSLTMLGYLDFIFAKECQRGRLLEIFVVIVLGKIKSCFMALGKNSLHVFRSQNLNYNMLVHMLVDQAGQLDLPY